MMAVTKSQIVFCVYVCLFLQVTARLELVRNGYEGLNIVIKDGVREDNELLTRIREVFTALSRKMYTATNNRAYLRDITVVLPNTWTEHEYDSIPAVISNVQMIVVGKHRKGLKKAPYVTGNVECGKGGQILHITPEFLLKEGVTPFGYHENVLLHEWGHLRWGLFDEYPSVKRRDAKGRKRYIQFYRSDGVWEPVRCTANIYGNSYTNCDKQKPCNVDDMLNIPANCKFCPAPDQTTRASLMSYQWLPALDSFCDKDHWETDGQYRHNSRATNLQNIICKGQSAWEVMRQHKDFSEESNLSGSPELDTTPNFRFVQRRGRVRVFVLDVSGSMSGNRLRRLQQAVTLVIKLLVETRSHVGMVQFNSDADILSDLKEIRNKKDRDDLIREIPESASGGTSIGAGLLKGLEVLNNVYANTRECEIILVTDGENTNNPSIQDVIDNIIESDVVVHTISVSQAADRNLAELAEETGGHHLTYLDSNTISFADAMAQVIYPSNTLANEDTPETVFSKGFTVSPIAPLTTVFRIDKGLGNSTTVTVMLDVSTDVTVEVTGPDNFQYQNNEQNTDMAVFELNSQIQTGEYIVSISTTNAATINVYVTSKPKSAEATVIRVSSWLSHSAVDYVSDSRVMLFAVVRKDERPVLGARVSAILESDADVSTIFELKDTGSGADSVAYDGVYTAFLIDSYFSADGRYNIKIEVAADNSTFILMSSEESNAIVNPDFAGDDLEETEEQVEEFSRLSLPGELTLTNYDATLGDRTPPARIRDLQIDNISPSESGVQSTTFTFTWTAVGDDLDVGEATRYEMFMGPNFTAVQNDPELGSNPVNISFYSPKPTGHLENLTMKVTVEDCDATCYVGIRAVDKVNNVGEMSNIVSIEADFQLSSTHSSASICSLRLGVVGSILLMAIIIQ